MKLSRVRGFVPVAVALSVMVIAACSDDDPPNYAGAAAQATAQFWAQEARAGVLPEGTIVEARGTEAVIELDVPEDAAEEIKARYCVEFLYIRAQEPFESHVRVYESTLIDDLWSVKATNPDGSCEGATES